MVHLQFDNVHRAVDTTFTHPWGLATLTPDIVNAQQYDVTVQLRMPRTPDNINTGNFMLDVKMYGPGEKGSGPLSIVKDGITSATGASQHGVLAHSRRPAILTYYSPLVELAYKATELHWYLLRWRDEAETLAVQMFEGVQFPKGWRNLPSTLRLEVQSEHRMQVYEAKVEFRARFRGLRWLMYNHRIISAVAFIAGFWTTEMVATGLAWLVLSMIMFPGDKDQAVVKKQEHENGRIKNEDADEDEMDAMSDTERTFPSYGSQPPLRYQSPVKKEESELDRVLQAPPAQGIEADDEDEDADFLLDERGRAIDSGLGTSLESSGGGARSVRRRRSRLSDPK